MIAPARQKYTTFKFVFSPQFYVIYSVFGLDI